MKAQVKKNLLPQNHFWFFDWGGPPLVASFLAAGTTRRQFGPAFTARMGSREFGPGTAKASIRDSNADEILGTGPVRRRDRGRLINSGAFLATPRRETTPGPLLRASAEPAPAGVSPGGSNLAGSWYAWPLFHIANAMANSFRATVRRAMAASHPRSTISRSCRPNWLSCCTTAQGRSLGRHLHGQ